MSKKKTALNIITEFLGRILTIILGIILPKLYIESFGSEVNGLLSSIANVLVYINLLEAGIGGASIQALYKVVNNDNDATNSILAATDKFYKRVGTYYLGVVCLLSLIYPICVQNSIGYWNVVIIILLSAFPAGLKYYFQGKYTVLLQADNRAYIISLIDNITNIIINFSKIILLTFGCDVIQIQIVYCLIDLVKLAIYYAYIKKTYPYLNLHVEPNEKAIGKKNYVLVHNVSATIFSNIDILVLSVFTDLTVVSVYTIYNMIFNNVNILMKSLANGIKAYIGQVYYVDVNEFKKIWTVFSIFYKSLVMAVTSVCGILIIPFLKIYTSSFSDVNYIDTWLPILFASTVYLDIIRWPEVICINATGHFKETSKQALFETVINLICSFALVYKLGIYGVLFATIIALFYRTLDMIIFVKKRIICENWIKDVGYVLSGWIIIICLILLSYNNLFCDNYVEFFVWAIKILFMGVCISLVYSIVFYRKNYTWAIRKVNLILFQNGKRK